MATRTERFFDIPQRRFPLLALGAIALFVGLHTGVQRLGMLQSAPGADLVMLHGPLMVSAFLGTVIGLERAVALGRTWGYSAPILTGAGGAFLIVGLGSWQGAVMISLGSLIVVVIFIAILRIELQSFVAVMGLGAAAWLVGNVLWVTGRPVFDVVGWWIGFLVLTIAGERLELTRMLVHGRWVRLLFMTLIAVVAAGLAFTGGEADVGTRTTGAGLMALAAWLLKYDVARYTVHQGGLTRFIAACLLAGYMWLFLGGLLMLWYGSQIGGPYYDAQLHAVFVGFVFSMIFAHAPIIFPSVLGVPVAYRGYYYLHLSVLHLSLVLRVLGDLGGFVPLRRWGSLLNAAAILFFLVVTVGTILLEKRRLDRDERGKQASLP